MPWSLPSASVPLDIISECGALHHWVVSFALDDVAIVFFEDSENFIDILKCVWISLLKDIISDSCNEQMALATPSLNLSDN